MLSGCSDIFRILLLKFDGLEIDGCLCEFPGRETKRGYLSKKAASMFKAQYIINGGIDKAQKIHHLLCALKLHLDSIVYHSQIAIKTDAQSNLRKLRNLPLEEDVAKFKL